MKHLVFSLFIVSIVFTSCTKKIKHIALVPSEAGIVSVIDIASLSEKGQLNEDKAKKKMKELTALYSQSNENASEAINTLISDPLKSGINFTKTILAYSILQDDKKFMCMAVEISDKDDFSNILTQALGKDFPVTEKSKYSLISDNQNFWIAFDEDKAIIVTSIETSPKIASAFVDRLFSLKEEETMAKNEAFVKFYEKKRDISVFVATTPLLSGMPEIAKSTITAYVGEQDKITLDDLKNNYLYTFIEFKKNAIEFDIQFIANEKLKKYILDNEISRDRIQDDIFAYFPQESLLCFTYACMPDKILENYSQTKDYKNVETMLKEQGINLSELVMAFGGDIMGSFYNMGIEVVEKNEKAMVVNEKGEVEYVDNIVAKTEFIPKASIVFSLVNQDLINSYLTKFIPAEMKKENLFYDLSSFLNFPLFVSAQNNMLMVTTDTDAITQLKNGGYTESFSTSDWAQEISGPAHLFLNLNYNTYPQQLKDIANQYGVQKIASKILSPFEQISISSKDSFSSDIEIVMKKGETNSLYQVIQMIDSTSKL